MTGALLAGCSERDDLAGDTVRVELPDRTVELEVISCGLDDDVFVLGASSADAFVQILLVTIDEDGAEEGDEEGDPAEVTVDIESSAFSVEVAREGILGAGSATLLQVRPGVPGRIGSASIRGDRIEIEGDARALDAGPDDTATPVSLEARCPAVEDFV